jgi:putative hydrolase of the HAD superfamily
MNVILYTDDLGPENWKPSHRPFQEALQRVGIQPVNAIYVADNPYKDFIGARSLGMGTVRIIRSGGLHAEVRLNSEHEADHEISNLFDLVDLLTTG